MSNYIRNGMRSNKPSLATLSVAPGGSIDSGRPVECIVAAVLCEDNHTVYWFPARGVKFDLGRDERDEVFIDDPRISRGHARIERLPDRIVIRVKRRMTVNGVEVTDAELRPGGRFELRGVRFVLLTTGMARSYADLDRLVGDPETVYDLITMARTEHAVLLGAMRAPLRDIAQKQHDAVGLPGTQFAHAKLGDGDDDLPMIEDVLPSTGQGRVFVDGRKRKDKGRNLAPIITRPLLERVAGRGQRTALTLGLSELRDVHPTLVRHGYRHFSIEPVADRLRTSVQADRDRFIDRTFAHLGLEWHAYDLRADFLSLLTSDRVPWTGDYYMFETVLLYANHAWRGDRGRAYDLHERFGRRMTSWLSEFGRGMEALAELAPESCARRRDSA